MQKAFGYVRVSTEQQATEGISIESQIERIKAYCLLNGFDLAGTYVDAGLSGTRSDRPELQRALDDCCAAKGVLLVYSLSRLARSTRLTIELAEKLEKAGADLASLSERIDTTTASGKMVFRMLAVLAEHERDLVSERTKAVLSHKKASGERTGTVPFGWDVASDGTTLIENSEEQQTLRTIVELRESGLSFHKIASRLTEAGRLTKNGKPKWVHTSVRSILARAGV